MPSKPSKYPFRFYGVDPGDWIEGANMGYAYELHFASAPSAAAKAAIAVAFESAIRDAEVHVGEWLWSGEWAVFLFGTTSGAKARDCFDAIEKACRAVHDAAPLVEVIFHNARELGGSAWERWTLKQQPLPSPGPAWPGLDFSLGVFGKQQRFRAKVKPKADRVFEKARSETGHDLRQASATAAAKKAVKRGKPALVPVKKAPPPTPVPRAHEKLFGPRADLGVYGGHTIGVDGDYATKYLGFVDGGKLKKVKLPFYEAHGIKPDGTRAIYSSNKVYYEVVLPKTRPVELLDLGPGGVKPSALAYGPGDTILESDLNAVILYSRASGGLEEVARLPLEPSSLHSFRDGALVVARTCRDRVVVIEATPTELVERASFKSDAYTAYEVDGRIFVEGNDGARELLNV